MPSGRTASRIVATLLVAALVTWYWRPTTADDSQKQAPKNDGAKPALMQQTLGGADRYLTHLSTDKPIYRVGDTIYLRGVLLHQATRKPMPSSEEVLAMIEVRGPKGDVVASGLVQAADSVLGFSWVVPDGQAGGQYTAKVSYPQLGLAPAERSFDIRAFRAPRLKSQIKFVRDGYGPGDEVLASLHVERADGGVPSGAKVTVIARVDGAESFRGPATIDDQGDCLARFPLPKQIVRGEGTLAMVIEDGGIVETASKTIPILLQTVDLTMYPEGGDLIAGLENRVYFEAFTPAKKPADLAGIVIDSDGREVSRFRSEHEGRGRFSLTPKAGEKYSLKITEPAGIHTQYELPEAKANGVVVSATADVFPADQPIQLNVASTTSDPLRVTLNQRETELASVLLDKLQPGTPNTVSLSTKDTADGVLIATVWSQEGKPLAERLIFRQPARSIQVKLTADAPQYAPGGRARITIETRDDRGEPVGTVVGVTVTDDSVLEMIDKREQAPRLPVMVLLENDVKELADAHIYLDAENKDAPRAVDLLLGTQGWRRFATVHVTEFMKNHGDDARRALALRLPTEREEWFGVLGTLSLAEVPKSAAAVDIPEKGDGAGQPIDESKAPLEKNERANEVNGPLVADGKRDEQAEASRPGDREAAANRPQQARELQQALRAAGESRQPAFLDDADRAPALRNDFLAVRVYAHQVRSDWQPGQRTDFRETLFWHAGIRTDDQGKATVEFGLNDSVTSFQVAADAFSAEGGLGSATQQIESIEPFYVEPKLPLEVTQGDYLRVPIGVVNGTGSPLNGASINIQSNTSQSAGSGVARFDLPAGARLRRFMNVRVGRFHGDVEFSFDAAAGSYSDRVTRSLKVQPLGFPRELAHGGLIHPDSTVSGQFTIPEDLVSGSLSGRVVVYPSPLASMTEALQALIREPGGCFEQTSSTVYPLVMAQQYFMSHQGVDPKLIEQSGEILERGYNRLIGFECKSGGYEWFGADPGHDALTAYGLLEFTDMAQVRYVDPAMIERTRKWLLGQRDGKGTFNRVTHTYHTWLPDPELAASYNTWALLEAGVEADLTTEVAWVRQAGEKSENSYVIALAANVMARANDKEGEAHLLDTLAGKQIADGSLQGATRSVVGSTGDALAIETTALAAMAWLQNERYAANVDKAIEFLAGRCKSGRFGSTQSTVLALRAITAYDQSQAQPKVAGKLQLLVDGKPCGQPVPFTAESQGAIALPDLAEHLTPGKHTVSINMVGGSQMPYSIAVELHTLKPDSSDDCKLHLEVALRDKSVEEGAVTEAEVVLVNRSDENLPCPTAIIGIPGGLEVRHDQLKELVKEEKIAAYEVLGREVVLYWRALKPEQRVRLPISMVAAVPGTYTGPASRAYLYYTDEHKHWVEGLHVELLPK